MFILENLKQCIQFFITKQFLTSLWHTFMIGYYKMIKGKICHIYSPYFYVSCIVSLKCGENPCWYIQTTLVYNRNGWFLSLTTVTDSDHALSQSLTNVHFWKVRAFISRQVAGQHESKSLIIKSKSSKWQ